MCAEITNQSVPFWKRHFCFLGWPAKITTSPFTVTEQRQLFQILLLFLRPFPAKESPIKHFYIPEPFRERCARIFSTSDRRKMRKSLRKLPLSIWAQNSSRCFEKTFSTLIARPLPGRTSALKPGFASPKAVKNLCPMDMRKWQNWTSLKVVKNNHRSVYYFRCPQKRACLSCSIILFLLSRLIFDIEHSITDEKAELWFYKKCLFFLAFN